MTNQTYYIDFNGGDDANDGLSFANRKKTFDGLISENDNSSNQNAHGDEYRVMGMPTVNTGVNATWTKGGYGNIKADGSSNSTKSITGATATAPIEITVSNHGYSTGDIVWIYNVRGIYTANGSWIITVTGTNTFTLNNSNGTNNTGAFSTSEGPTARQINHKGIKVNTQCKRVAFSSGSTQTSDNNINASDGIQPVGSTNVTINTYGWILNLRMMRSVIAGGFTTGKAWYYTLPEELDLSAYQGISFNIYNRDDTDSQKANKEIRLCSDTTGDVAVNTIKIRSRPSSGNMTQVTDTGGNLGSSIKSVALYITSDEGAEDLRFANIIAFKTSVNDVITHDDCFSKNTTAEPIWWKGYYIQEDHILFGFNTKQLSSQLNDSAGDENAISYSGVSETVAFHKVTPFNIYGSADENSNYDAAGYLYKFLVRLRLDSRLRTNQELTKITGGWNTTDMSSQDSITWVNIFSDNHTFIDTNATGNVLGSNILVERFGIGLGNNNLNLLGHKNLTAKNIYQCGFADNAAIVISNANDRRNILIDGLFQTSGFIAGIQANATSSCSGYRNLSKIIIKNMHLYGTYQQSSLHNLIFIEDLTVRGSKYLLLDSNYNIMQQIQIKNLTANGLYSTFSDLDIRAENATVDLLQYETHPHTVNNQGTTTQGSISLGNYNGDANDHRIYVANGHIKSETTVRHGTDGVAWKIQPRLEHTGNKAYSAVNNTVHAPLNFSVAKLFVEANKVVTFKAYVRRDNTGITATVAARQDRNIYTISSDVAVTCTAGADTWQELTLSITPVNSGELYIDFEAFGGNSHTAYIDDISVTQAV